MAKDAGHGLAPAGRGWRKTSVGERAAVLLCIFILYFLGLFIYPALIYLAVTRWPLLWFLMFEYIFYCNSPAGRRAARTAHSGWPRPLRHWSLYRVVARYFPITIHKTVDATPGRPYICTLHPHGIMSFAGFVGFVTDGADYDRVFPGSVFHGLTVELAFKTPFLREFHLLHGTCDVSREAFINVLGAGGTVGVVVGGGTESLLATPGTHRIILRRRKGFIKMALLTGASLIPGYAFGESNLYRTSNELPSKSPLRRFQRWMIRSLGFTMPIFRGQGVVLPWGLVPYPAPIDVVIGGPIEVPKYEGPTDSAEFRALVDKYHGQYTTALVKLFEDHRERFAKGEGPLEIVE